MTDTEHIAIYGEEQQWLLLLRMHEGGCDKMGPFLKTHGFPCVTQKPHGKYYAQIRNKNVRVMDVPAEERINFINSQLMKFDKKLTDIRQLPCVFPMKLIDILAGLPADGKLKLIDVLGDLDQDAQGRLIGILGGL